MSDTNENEATTPPRSATVQAFLGMLVDQIREHLPPSTRTYKGIRLRGGVWHIRAERIYPNGRIGISAPCRHAPTEPFHDSVIVSHVISTGRLCKACMDRLSYNLAPTTLSEKLALLDTIVEPRSRTIVLTKTMSRAVHRGDSDSVLVLMALGGRVDTPDVMFRAVESGSVDLVRLLAGEGVSVNGDRPNDTPLLSAIQHDHLAMVEALVDLGADRERGNLVSKNAIELARRWNRPDMVAVLERAELRAVATPDAPPAAPKRRRM